MAVSLSGMTLHTNNDNESGWGGTDGPDTYNNAIQGTNSESWLVAKNSTETGTLTKSSTLNATRGLFVFWMSSNLAPYYTDIKLDLQSTTNNYKQFTVANSTNKAIGGNFVASAVDYVNKGTATGTFAPASFAVARVIVNNSSSGNIRSVINNWVDAMYYGPGHTVSGTTTGDELFAEAAAVDETSTNRYGILQNYNGVIFSQGDLDLSGTALTSDSETLVFVDTLNGYDTYNLDITGTVTFTNSAVIAAGTIDYNFDSSGATSFTQNGGSHSGYATFVTAASQTMDGIVFQNGGTATIANTVSNSTFNQCGQITISGAGELDTCTINESTATAAVSCSNLNDVDNCTFISDGTGHAVDLGTIAATTSMNWNCSESGYAAQGGTAGNRTILVNVASGQTLTINVAAGASTPTYYNTGSGTVSVVSGQVTLTLTGLVTGTEVRIYSHGTTTELDGIESSGTSFDYTYTYSAGTYVDIVVHNVDYEYIRLDNVLLGSGDASLPIQQVTDRWYSNP